MTKLARPLRSAAWYLAALTAAAGLMAAGPARADMDVVVDQAKVMRLPPQVATIVIGNPAIADVTLQKSGIAVLTGKSYGSTNMIVLDRTGQTLSEEQITVHAQDVAIVTVQRGLARESLTCTPNCERIARVGDAQENFDLMNTQASARSGIAVAAPTAAPK